MASLQHKIFFLFLSVLQRLKKETLKYTACFKDCQKWHFKNETNPAKLQIGINTFYTRFNTKLDISESSCWKVKPFLHSVLPQGNTDLSTQQSTIRWVGTLVGLSIAGVSDLIQAKNALILRFLSSTAFPSHSFFRLGQVHSLNASASTSSGVCGDFPL